MKARFLALAALVLGLASCQNDFEAGNIVAGGEVDFQLSVGAPELATRAGEDGADTQNAKDSAFGAIDYLQGAGWSSVDLRYSLEVYDVTEDTAGNKVVTNTTPVKDRQVKVVDAYEPVVFDLRLVPNREYRFVVFADFVAQGATANPTVTDQATIGLRHDIGDTLQEITIKEDADDTKWLNDEVADAYFAFKDIEITNSKAQDMVLRRPYGKLRVIATDLAELNLNVDPKAVVVKYDRTHNNQFNAVTGIISGGNTTESTYKVVYNNSVGKESLADHTYTDGYDAKTVKNANNETRHSHITLFTDYILAEAEQTPIHFTMKVYDNAAMADTNLIKETAFTTDIPVQRNYLTTVIGNVLTTATEIEVRIDDNFAGEIFVDGDIKDQLAEAAMQKNYVINLDGDFIWETGAAHGSNPLIPADAITETLTINGNGHKFIATGTGVGAIRLANGGKLILNNLTVVDQSEYHAENGEVAWEFTYLEFAGETEFNNCVIDNTVALDGAKAVFNNCTFNDKVTWPSNAGQEYAAWVSNGIVHFNNCDINGDRGIKVHEAYGTEVEEVLVNESRFNNISKKPGMAIGTVNAATKIEIKNSTFTNCQPGDQGLYMYETDTDVTTFDFSQTNNTVNATVATSEAFATILKADIHTLNIALAADVTVDVSAHVDSYYFGGNNTNTITIDGAKVATAAATGANDNAYTLTFNHKNSDWNYIRFNNDNAKWVIKNVKLTNSGYNNGPWNRHDIRFYNDVVLENVTSDKAIALLADADLTNVVISDVHPNNSDAYALWITAEGQTVNIKDCALLAHESKSGDRGIKIEQQYIDAPAKVTLNIDGLKVKSQKKAAIMVNSKAGAHIAIKNIDLSEVAEDTVNAVWVDESSKQYTGLVSVTGASMVVEGVGPIEGDTVDALQTAFEAAVTTENAIVQLPAGEYTMPNNIAKGVTIICAEGAVFNGKSTFNINGATVVGATFQSGDDNLVSFHSQVNGTYKNCTFNGDLKFCYAGNTVVFEDCVFNGPDYALHFDSNATGATNTNVILRRCEVNSDWRVAIGAAISMFEATDCKFNVVGFINMHGKATLTNCEFNKPMYWIANADYSTYTNCKYEGRAITAEDIYISETIIEIDGKYYAEANSADELTAILTKVTPEYSPLTIVVKDNIAGDATAVQKENVKVTIEGNKYNYDGTIFVNGRSSRYATTSLTIKDLNFNSSNINADAYINLGKSGDNNTRYTSNVTVMDCTFSTTSANDVVAVKSYTGGDLNLNIIGCTINSGMHSLAQLSNIETGLKFEGCKVYSKNGVNLNNTPTFDMTECAFDVQGYAVRVGVNGNVNTNTKTFNISNSSLKSACDDGDAVIIFRDSATNSVLTLNNTTLTGSTEISGNTDATIINVK